MYQRQPASRGKIDVDEDHAFPVITIQHDPAIQERREASYGRFDFPLSRPCSRMVSHTKSTAACAESVGAVTSPP